MRICGTICIRTESHSETHSERTRCLITARSNLSHFLCSLHGHRLVKSKYITASTALPISPDSRLSELSALVDSTDLPYLSGILFYPM